MALSWARGWSRPVSLTVAWRCWSQTETPVTGRCERRWRAHSRRRVWRCCSSTTAATVAILGDRARTGSPAMFVPRDPPAGLVLRSPFVDLASVGRFHYPFLPVRTLLRDRYPLAERLASVKVPTTVVYGSRDSIVPPEQSRAVAAAAAGETRVVEIAGADHNDRALLDGEKLIEAVVELAERVCEAPRTGGAGDTSRPSPPPARPVRVEYPDSPSDGDASVSGFDRSDSAAGGA